MTQVLEQYQLLNHNQLPLLSLSIEKFEMRSVASYKMRSFGLRSFGLRSRLYDIIKQFVHESDEQICQRLQIAIESGAGVNKRNGIYTPLMHACYYNRYQYASLLIDYGADVDAIAEAEVETITDTDENVCDDTTNCDIKSYLVDGRTALYIACQYNSFECVQVLLNAGARYHINCALILCVNAGKVLYVAALINAGANVNSKDTCGNTALEIACKCQQLIIAKLLIKSGCNYDISRLKKYPIIGQLLYFMDLKNNGPQQSKFALDC